MIEVTTIFKLWTAPSLFVTIFTMITMTAFDLSPYGKSKYFFFGGIYSALASAIFMFFTVL